MNIYHTYYMYMSYVLCMYRRIGPRSHIWCEKELVEKAAWEFEEVQNYSTSTIWCLPSCVAY